jgi:stearoyl-CoA desaturase (Delta-9 desaturase)
MNKNFLLVLLPFHIIALTVGLFNLEYWPWLLLFWFLFGVIGNGVAGHRYFAHNQFQCSTFMRYLLAVLTTLGAYAPVSYWRLQHLHHHANSDTELDVHSPKHGTMFNTFYGWILTDKTINAVVHRNKLALRVMRDPFYANSYRYHYSLIFAFSVVLLAFDPYVFSMYCLAYVVDVLRLGSVNYFCHRSGYRLHDTKDDSRNNVWIGILGMGFGWHNTHHAFPDRLILTEKWWEVDAEGCIGWMLSKL